MIQFNLLPDVKQEFVKVTRTRRIVTLVSMLMAGAVLIVFLLLLAFNGLQKKNLSDLNKDIAEHTATLKKTPDLDKILTVQNQLRSLPNVQSQVPVTSRTTDYLRQLTPNEVTISNLRLDLAESKLSVTGDAPGLEVVNKYVDTLKFTEFTTGAKPESQKAFSNVVLTAFTRSEDTTTYTIDFNFSTELFSGAEAVSLKVPSIISTRSQVNQPTTIFQQSSSTTNIGTQ